MYIITLDCQITAIKCGNHKLTAYVNSMYVFVLACVLSDVYVAEQQVGVLSWVDTQRKGRIIMTSLSVIWFSTLHRHSSLVLGLQKQKCIILY